MRMLRMLDQTGEREHSISHLIGARNEARKVVLSFLLTFNHSLHDARMVGTKVDEAMRDPGLPFDLELFLLQLQPFFLFFLSSIYPHLVFPHSGIN